MWNARPRLGTASTRWNFELNCVTWASVVDGSWTTVVQRVDSKCWKFKFSTYKTISTSRNYTSLSVNTLISISLLAGYVTQCVAKCEWDLMHASGNRFSMLQYNEMQVEVLKTELRPDWATFSACGWKSLQHIKNLEFQLVSQRVPQCWRGLRANIDNGRPRWTLVLL